MEDKEKKITLDGKEITAEELAKVLVENQKKKGVILHESEPGKWVTLQRMYG